MTAIPVSGPAAAAPRRAVSPRALLAVGAAVVVAAVGGGLILMPKATVSTDAAYVEADSSTVAPKVRGLVSEVLVRHNQSVRRGQPLVRIDPEEFDSRVAAADADLQNAQAAVLAAQAAFVALDAEERLAASTVLAARSTIRSADAQNDRAQADRVRYERLVASGAVARRDVELYRAAAISAASDADRQRAQLDVSQDQASVTHAKRATLTANLAQAQAAVARAQAAVTLARQDQDHALVRAPIDGVVGDRQVEPGDYVQPGTRMLTVVPLGALYVTANFKETQVSRMTAGQPASVKVDALPGVTLRGRVDSFAPGSGSQFSLLPFEPGTGNFTKIVQRVPVRIRLDPGQAGLQRLRPGLSTTVKVRLAAPKE
ncbi:MAG: efflux transporter, family, subunit [Caulobacter sp.]|nr:efflux transporter, family, subunit [Caulobacter sp.]